jgi:hypothetical protein
MIKEVNGDILFSDAKVIAHSVAPMDHFDTGLAALPGKIILPWLRISDIIVLHIIPNLVKFGLGEV